MHRAEADLVKQTTLAGRLLREAGNLVANVGMEANSIRKSLLSLEGELAHHVSRSGVEMKSFRHHMRRAEDAFAVVCKVYQEGMAELRQKKAILEQIEASEAIGEKFENKMKRLKRTRSVIKKVNKSAKHAQEKGDVRQLQKLLTSLNDEKDNVLQAVEAGRTLVAEMAVREQALEETLADVTSDSLKDDGEDKAKRLKKQKVALQEALREETERADAELAAASEEIAERLEKRLEDYAQVVKDSDAWLNQSASYYEQLMADLHTKEQAAAAAKKAAGQFQERLMEDIAEAQAQVAVGMSDWDRLEAQYSVKSRVEIAKHLKQEADAAMRAVAGAAGKAQKYAHAIYKEAEKVRATLDSSEKLARELADSAKHQQEWWLSQELHGHGKEAVLAATEAASAGRRAQAAKDLAASSSGLSNAVEQKIIDMKSSMEEMQESLAPKVAPGEYTSREGAQQRKTRIISDVSKYVDQAKNHLDHSNKHLKNAKEMRTKLDHVKETLEKDVEALKDAFQAVPIDALLKQISGETSDGGPIRPADGETPEDTPCSPGGPQAGRLGCLATIIERRVVHLLAIAAEMKKQGESCEKAQHDAQQDLANLRLTRLRAITSLEEIEDAQDLLTEAKTLPRQVGRALIQQGEELQDFRAQEGGQAALRDLVDGILQQLWTILELCEGRLAGVMNTGVPELESRMAAAQAAAERLHLEKAAADAVGALMGETVVARVYRQLRWGGTCRDGIQCLLPTELVYYVDLMG